MRGMSHVVHRTPGSTELSQWAFSIVAAALVCTLVCLYLRKMFQPQTRKRLPGPWALPLVGTLGIKTTASLFKKSVGWMRLYGPIFRVKIGTANAVILNDIEHIKKFYSSKNAVFRPTNAIVEELRNSNRVVPGISNLNGKAWTLNKNFIVHLCGDLGFGKPSIEEHITEELQDLVGRISNTSGGLINVRHCITDSVANVTAALLFGSRFDIGDAKRDYLVKLIENVLYGTKSGLMVDWLPIWLSRVITYFALNRTGQIRKSRLMIQEIAREKISEHKKTLNPGFNRDFIDGYLEKIREHRADPASPFNEENLLGNTAEFFLSGTGPSTIRIFWFLHICAQNPNEVQTKIQKEIDNVVGRHRPPTWEDRKSMPFTMASLKETLRWMSGAIGGARGVLEDIFIGDYLIPKGTVVLLNLRAVLRSPLHWKNPDAFDPTRFMTNDDTALGKNENAFIPFGVGKRSCPGQSLGIVEMFLYIATLLQKFSVFPEYADKLESMGSPDATTDDPQFKRLRFVSR